MRNIRLLLFGFLIIFVAGCSEIVTEPVGDWTSPQKLGPYETSIDLEGLKSRRDALIKRLPANSLVVVTTNDVYLRNGDVNYEFMPASSFLYLTRFEEPNAVAVIRTKAGSPGTAEMIMFVEERTSSMVQWLGPCYGPEGAVKYFGADSAYGFGQFKSKLTSYLGGAPNAKVYANLNANMSVSNSYYTSTANPPPVSNLDSILAEMRVVKSAHEINLIQKSTDVAVQAFKEAMKRITPGMFEYEVAAILNYVLSLNGCPRAAFPTIVASGPNINTLHYDANTRQLQDGDLVMIDFGAEYGYYASDVTRTLPVNGVFSAEQRAVYEIVLEAYKTAIQGATPGKSYYELSALARDKIVTRLLEKGIVYGDKATILSTSAYRLYIPAGLAHCVGLDTHDPFPRSDNPDLLLKENMVFAFEPHIYLQVNDQTVNPKYRGISARIEDVVLITNAGGKILSKSLPNEISEIEEFLKW